MSLPLKCKTFNTESENATFSLSGRVKLFAFATCGKVRGPYHFQLKSKDRNGEVLCELLSGRDQTWGYTNLIHTVAEDGILFPDGIFCDTYNSINFPISFVSLFYQG